jgi:hypothetical protein
MLIKKPGAMKQFGAVPSAVLFLTFIDGAQMFGMKIKTKTGLDAVLHLAGGEPKIVDEDHFANRDVLVLEEPEFQFPAVAYGKNGNPENKAYGALILSVEGVFLRASHRQGPFDVDLESGLAQQSRNHLGSIWFDSWDVLARSAAGPELLFGYHKKPKVKG